jgi:hypothetical protein
MEWQYLPNPQAMDNIPNILYSLQNNWSEFLDYEYNLQMFAGQLTQPNFIEVQEQIAMTVAAVLGS